MAQAIRQSQLFAAEDWKVIYRAFSQVNFNAYDFDSIREAMIQYVRINFPEDYNDWIESSEFVAIIDLLAYLGESMAFRMDLNARDNFIDSAERRESVLRLARLISYNPRRNLPATGLLKITQITTDENIYDSNGVNLANLPIRWNDANNPDWFERFILVLNAALLRTNPFGRAVSTGTVGGVPVQLYQMNNSFISRGVLPFSAIVNGEDYDFEIVNPDFTDGESFFERAPNPFSRFSLLYRNDGRGNQSADTGVFLMFKQGSLVYSDFQFDIPIENRVIEIDGEDVNDIDVWVQEVDDNANVLADWTKVPAVVGSNVIYNSINRTVRNIFSVVTRDRDQISVRFADGRFGNVPTGLFRVWTRRSAGRLLDVRPQDLGGRSVNLTYYDANNEIHNLTLQYSLQYPVRNSQARETADAIKRRAPQMYYTQNRMVNGEDYNVLPLSTNLALKLKAINRTYSGHSRFIDLNDPTGSYQNTNVFADDGILYREFEEKYQEEPLPTPKDSEEIIEDRIVPLMQSAELTNFFNWYMMSNLADGAGGNFQEQFSNRDASDAVKETAYRWRRASNALYSTTGAIGYTLLNAIPVGPQQAGLARYISEGATIKFEKSGWATVHSVLGTGTLASAGLSENDPGPIVLNHAVEDGDLIEYVVPSFRLSMVTSEKTAIRQQIIDQNSFGLHYNFLYRRWEVIPQEMLRENGDYVFSRSNSFGSDRSWLIKVIYTPTAWQITSRGMQYVFESKDQVRFFFLNRYKVVDIQSGLEKRDTVRLLRSNHKPNSDVAFGRDITLSLNDSYTYPDGYVEPRRVKVVPHDSDDDGAPDLPMAFDALVFEGRYDHPWRIEENSDGAEVPQPDNLLKQWEYLTFWETYQDYDGYFYRRPLVKNSDVISYDTSSATDYVVGKVGYSISDGLFYVADEDNVKPTTASDPNAFMVREGRGIVFDPATQDVEGLHFQWKHFAPYDHRIDPSRSNIMDMFVLTYQYYNEVQTWLSMSNLTDDPLPAPPTPEELRIMFQELKDYKSASDEMIFHSVKFKTLFGNSAREELRVRFKVVKLPSTTLSDGEIKSRVIAAINEYFDIRNWDFGESFYFTELGAYVHQQMATHVASIIPVPLNEEAKFGSLFQVKCEADELFLSTAKVTDIQIVDYFTPVNMRIGN